MTGLAARLEQNLATGYLREPPWLALLAAHGAALSLRHVVVAEHALFRPLAVWDGATDAMLCPVQPPGGAEPVPPERCALGGRDAFDFGGAAKGLCIEQPAEGAGLTLLAAVGITAEMLGDGATNVLLHHPGAAGAVMLQSNPAGKLVAQTRSGETAVATVAAGVHVVAATFGVGTLRLWVDTAAAPVATKAGLQGPAWDQLNGWTLGSSVTGANPWGGPVGAVAIFAADIATSPQWAALFDAMKAEYGVA